MNRNEQQTSNANTKLDDLAVAEAEQAEIKGGPKKIFIGGLSVKETVAALPDLEPKGEIKGGPGSGGFAFNHNETVASDDAAEAEALDDLPVTADQQAEIKSGAGSGGTRPVIFGPPPAPAPGGGSG